LKTDVFGVRMGIETRVCHIRRYTMIALQGYFEGDKFIHPEAINIPRHKKAIVTILDEPVVHEQNADAWRTFLSAIKDTDEPLSGGPERVTFNRVIPE
jgi:hypothetical protein